MRRFFAHHITDGFAFFDEAELAHIKKVLRMKAGEAVIVPEGRGEWVCELCEKDGELAARLIERRGCDAEPKKEITLYLAYTKSDKMELCVQKAVELGAARICPFFSSRCVKLPDAKSAEKGNIRFSRIAHEAVKQCGRAQDIEISMPLSFDGLLKRIAEEELSVFAFERSDAPLKNCLCGSDAGRIGLIIGPEGGFSDEEAERIQKSGAVSVSLGTRILRAETAAVALMAIVSYETEN